MTYLTDHGANWRMTIPDGFMVYSKSIFPTIQSVAAHLSQDVILIVRKKVNVDPMHVGYCHKECGCFIHYRYTVTTPDGQVTDCQDAGYKSSVSAYRAAVRGCPHPLNVRYWNQGAGLVACGRCDAKFISLCGSER